MNVLSESAAPDVGAYGMTSAEGAESPAPHMALRFPDLYFDWERDKPVSIRWETYGNTADSPVRIDLYQDSPDGPTYLLTIAASTPDDGEFLWIPADSGIDYGTYGLRIHVSLTDNPAVFDRGAESFKVPENTTTFYVNDSVTTGDEYTTAPGNNRNTGKLPNAPKPYPNNVLRIYTLGPTDTLFVDTGDYSLLDPIVLSGNLEIADDEGFVLTGPTSSARVAGFRFANPLTVAPLITLDDADLMTIAHLTLSGAQMGLYLTDNSTDLIASYLTLTGNAQDGLRAVGGSSTESLDHITATGNAGDGLHIGGAAGVLTAITATDNRGSGLWVSGTVVSLADSTFAHNLANGVDLSNPGAVHIEGVRTEANRGGIAVQNSGAGMAVIGNADLAKGRGNLVLNNTSFGISAGGNVWVVGNAVTGQTNSGATGIATSGATVTDNIVYLNYEGIGGSGTIERNRVYQNTTTGIRSTGGTVRSNVVYSNATGMVIASTDSEASHNLVYGNSGSGVRIQGLYGGLNFVNNTVYQLFGNAITVDANTPNIHLRNNLLWVNAGYAISVDTTSQTGFTSDFNLFQTTGTGQVGFWQGQARRVARQLAVGLLHGPEQPGGRSALCRCRRRRQRTRLHRRDPRRPRRRLPRPESLRQRPRRYVRSRAKHHDGAASACDRRLGR